MYSDALVRIFVCKGHGGMECMYVLYGIRRRKMIFEPLLSFSSKILCSSSTITAEIGRHDPSSPSLDYPHLSNEKLEHGTSHKRIIPCFHP